MYAVEDSSVIQSNSASVTKHCLRAAFLLLVCATLLIPMRVQALERVDAITLPSGYRAESVLMHPAGQFAYVLSNGEVARLVKIELSTMDVIGDVPVAESGEGASFLIGAIDSVGTYAYIAYAGTGLHLAKINLGTMQRVDAATISQTAMSIVIDPADTYAYLGSDEGLVEKVDLATLLSVGVVQTGQQFLRSATIDAISNSAYFGTFTIPGNVVKIDLATFQWAGVLTLGEGEFGVRAAAVDPTGTAAYFATYTDPIHVVKVDLATFQRVGGISLGANESSVGKMRIDPAGQSAYVGTVTSPPRLVEVDLGTFQRTGSTIIGIDDAGAISLGMGAFGEYVYAGTIDGPGRMLKVALRDPVPNDLSFEPAHVDFHAVEVGGDSVVRAVNVRNSGTGMVSSVQFGALGEGLSADTAECAMPLGPGEACSVALAFTPVVTGVTQSNWRASSDQGATAHLSIRSSVVPASQSFTVVPAVLDFGAVDVGTTSAPMMATLTNTGTQSAMIITISSEDGPQFFTPDLSDCDSLAPGASCNISITFTPSYVAPVGRTLSVVGGSSPPMQTFLSVAGSGNRYQYAVRFNQPSVSFGSVDIGEIRLRSVSFRNLGTDNLTQVTLTTSDPSFSVTDILCTSLAAGSSCTADVAFSPTKAGAANATLRLATTEGATAEIPMDGLGTGDSNPAKLAFDLAALEFGEVGLGTVSNARTVVLRNDGTGVAIITMISAMEPEFSVDSTACGASLGPAMSCEVRVQFRPLGPIQVVDQLVVTTDQGVAASMPISGTGSTNAIFQGGFD